MRPRRAPNAQLPALHGIPIAHKDLTDVAGVPTTHGSAAFPHPRRAVTA
ncbi:amidase family protein [Leucobacter luti]|nr:amidase family protein [Leucobacter luti]